MYTGMIRGKCIPYPQCNDCLLMWRKVPFSISAPLILNLGWHKRLAGLPTLLHVPREGLLMTFISLHWNKTMRLTGVLRILAIVFTLVTTWLFASAYFNYAAVRSVNLRSWLGTEIKPTKAPPVQSKCHNKKTCPDNTFNFRITSGAANVVGPSMCFDNVILMSSVKNNIGRGLNIALINGTTGQPQKMEAFDMYSGDIKNLVTFLKGIERGTLVLIASYDDPATKLNDEARKLLADLGSTYATKLGFRDNWIFLGGKGIRSKSPFEEYLKNDKVTNKYDGWPEVLEMEGCVPRKID